MNKQRIKPQIYKFVFVNTNMGYYESYNIIETNIPLDHLKYIELDQKLSRSQCNHAEAFCKMVDSYYHNKSDKYMKLIGETTEEPIEGYPLYYGYSGNY